jgi:hypothetical protein
MSLSQLLTEPLEEEIVKLRAAIKDALEHWDPIPEGEYYHTPGECAAKARLEKLAESWDE